MDDLLPYYNRELAYLRKLGAEFAEKHPKIAGRLRMSGEVVEDPHVSRLVESVALLTARVRKKIDDDFPEIAEAMLGVLCPHFVKPFPSASIVQFTLGKASWAATEPQLVTRGSEVETDPIEGAPCRFRTCYPVELWPVRVSEASLASMPARAPNTIFTPKSGGVLRLRLETLSPKVRFADLNLRSLRFYLHGQAIHANGLYERLLNNAVGVAIDSGDGGKVVTLPPGAIQPMGYGPDEGLVDYDARSFLGYRLLTEYFVLPEKFLFVELNLNEKAIAYAGDGRVLYVFVYLDQHDPGLERNVDASTFRLGCAPVANLFEYRAEPIRLTGEVSEYRVVPDARRPLAHEVVSVDQIVARTSGDESVELQPLYHVEHGAGKGSRVFWHAARRPATMSEHRIDHGAEVYLSLVDLETEPMSLDGWTIDARVTCCNRDLPGRLPFGGGQPHLRLASGSAAEVVCLTPPTRTLRPSLGAGAAWRLVSKLCLNHSSLVANPDTLREVLSLYDFVATSESRTLVEAIIGVSSRRVVGRVGATGAAFCRGVEVSLHLDEERFSAGGRYLFASVIERFLALYTSINSFTTTRVTTNRVEGTLKQWPPRAGDRVLV